MQLYCAYRWLCARSSGILWHAVWHVYGGRENIQDSSALSDENWIGLVLSV